MARIRTRIRVSAKATRMTARRKPFEQFRHRLGRNTKERRVAGNHAAGTLGDFAARQCFARIRTRRRPEGRSRRARAHRRCGQARRQAQQPRIRHPASHRSGISRPAEDAPARSAAFVPGTNDQPGDYRASGCTACHVVYANDRRPRIPRNTRRSAIAASALRTIRRFP